MTDVEFLAVIEANQIASEAWAWNPTDAELHAMFWSTPLPVLDARVAAGPTPLPVLEPPQAPSTAAPSALMNAGQPTATRVPHWRWRVEIYAGSEWFPVQGTENSCSQSTTEYYMAYHRKIQPHARFRVAQYLA